jgi:hypothetical protein
MRKTQRYGWKPDIPDFRDIHYRNVHSPEAVLVAVPPIHDNHEAVLAEIAKTPKGADGLPKQVSLRKYMPPVFNQGNLGSCTGNASATMWAFVHGGGPYSRLQIYYDERMIEGTVKQDAGAQIRDAIKVLATNGAGPEADWPYIEKNFAKAPPIREVQEALENRAVVYSRLQTRKDFRECLSQGFPFIIGFTVYDSFESEDVAQDGIVPMPDPFESLVGGHAICVIGYNTDIHGGDYYEVRNSWGEDWGDEGNFWIPAEYLEDLNLACDAWTVRK